MILIRKFAIISALGCLLFLGAFGAANAASSQATLPGKTIYQEPDCSGFCVTITADKRGHSAFLTVKDPNGKTVSVKPLPDGVEAGTIKTTRERGVAANGLSPRVSCPCADTTTTTYVDINGNTHVHTTTVVTDANGNVLDIIDHDTIIGHTKQK